MSSGDLGPTTTTTQVQEAEPEPDPEEEGPEGGPSAADVLRELKVLRAELESRLVALESNIFDQGFVATGSHPGGSTLNIAVTSGLKDGEVAHIEAVLRGRDAQTGQRAVFVREFVVKKVGGVVSSLGGVGWADRYTSKEDATWKGPTAIVDVDGQAGVTLSGDDTNSTRWVARSAFRIFAPD